MSRITERDIELDNYWETYLVTKEWYEFNEERDEGKDAYCNECRKNRKGNLSLWMSKMSSL